MMIASRYDNGAIGIILTKWINGRTQIEIGVEIGKIMSSVGSVHSKIGYQPVLRLL